MWNRLHYVSWISILFFLLCSGSSIAYARPHLVNHQSRIAKPDQSFDKFTGSWVAHGASMVVSDDGSVTFVERTYKWCDANTAQPCDSIEHNHIEDGYQERLSLTSAHDGIAYGTVISSNNPSAQPGTSFTLTLGNDNTLVYSNQNHTSTTLLCGPAAPAGTCGA
jgi:hypothetical protein